MAKPEARTLTQFAGWFFVIRISDFLSHSSFFPVIACMKSTRAYPPDMKFVMAVVAYLVIGFVLGWGILLAVKGHLWLLIVGALAYVVAFGRIGCLPKKSH